MNRAVFLDRDGVINEKLPEGRYVTCRQEFRFISGVAEAIALLNRATYSVIIVSNQRCVAKGLVTVHELESIHNWMCQELAKWGAIIKAVYYCPHEKQPPCSCRKPAPGMLLTAARVHQIDLRQSWLIGDSEIDIEAGKRAGCKTGRILGRGESANSAADVLARSLLDAVYQLLKIES